MKQALGILVVVVAMAIFIIPFATVVVSLAMARYKELKELPTPELKDLAEKLQVQRLACGLWLPSAWGSIDGGASCEDPFTAELSLVNSILAERGVT